MPQKNVGPSLLQAASRLFLVLGLASLLLAGSQSALAGDAAKPSEEARASSTELPEEFDPAEDDPSLQEERQSIARMQNRVEDLEKKIATIRDQALDNNPQLEKQLRDLVLTRNEVMEKNLAAEDVDIGKLKELQKSLESDGIKAAEKKELEKEFKDMFLGYKRAEMRTQRNATVQRLRQDFYSDLLEAFKAEDPKAEQLISELNRLKHQLRYAKEDALPEQGRNEEADGEEGE